MWEHGSLSLQSGVCRPLPVPFLPQQLSLGRGPGSPWSPCESQTCPCALRHEALTSGDIRGTGHWLTCLPPPSPTTSLVQHLSSELMGTFSLKALLSLSTLLGYPLCASPVPWRPLRFSPSLYLCWPPIAHRGGVGVWRVLLALSNTQEEEGQPCRTYTGTGAGG